MLDINTLFFCALTAQTLLIVMLTVVFWGRFRDGLGVWITACSLEVAGWLLFMAAPFLPAILATATAVTLFSLCLSLSRTSLKRFFHAPVTHWEIWLVPLLLFTQQAATLGDDYSRIVCSNTVLGAQALWCCLPLLKPNGDGTDRSRYMLIAGFTLSALSLFARAGLTFRFPELMPDLRSHTPVNVASMLSTFLTVVLINVGILMMHQDRAWFKNLRLALTDSLTGLLNRRALMESGAREVAVARRRNQSLIAIMLDLDFFKKLNDAYGHPAGDAALKLFASCIREQVRQSDLVARYGGEEFCVILTGGQLADAERLTQRIRAQLEAKANGASFGALRFSAGVSAWVIGEPNLDAAIARADGALYRAKEAGRNRTVLV